ncbi:MAG TPA: phosphotransferase [Kofleriaceae bacterium]|nr:phosphotransferase [Kofleriaceae bacterium]
MRPTSGAPQPIRRPAPIREATLARRMLPFPDMPVRVGDALRRYLDERFPGSQVEGVWALGSDAAVDDTAKRLGYGEPRRVRLRSADGQVRDLVFHMATPNAYGHDRRADRAADLILAYDTFPTIPRQVAALDLGIVTADGGLRSLADGGELFLVTEFATGRLYADDLRRIAATGRTSTHDHRRVEALASYLAGLHAERVDRPAAYVRSVRDVVGSGQGIFGIIDGYGDDVPGAPPERLHALQARCVDWRWRARGREARLARIHGDFHPFNILFDAEDRLTLLDASRGCLGDPADDVTALAVNHVFFAIGRPQAWRHGLGPLWHELWAGYLGLTRDAALLETAPLYLAWRLLVLCSPRWYPGLTTAARDALLGLAERALDAGRFDPESADALFAKESPT